jgi:hypothetical protein
MWCSVLMLLGIDQKEIVRDHNYQRFKVYLQSLYTSMNIFRGISYIAEFTEEFFISRGSVTVTKNSSQTL